MNTMVTQILKKEYFNKQDTIVLALSGGVDSMVLFDILLNLPLNLNIVVAHVNHNKRHESFNEYDEIKRICISKNVPFEGHILPENISGNFHEEARKIRYEFFYDVAAKYQATKICLAHHSDDQLETILMRFVRGSSFIGYAGMKERIEYKNIPIVRPLLDYSKQDILEYAKQYNISYFEDESNKSNTYTRNRFRNEIIPLIKEENTHITDKINQFSSYIVMANEFIDKEVSKFIKQHFIDGTMNLDEFLKIDQIIQIKVLKYMINSKSFDTVEVHYNQYLDLLELLANKHPNVTYNLGKDFVLVKVYKSFYIEQLTDNKRQFLEINHVGEYIISKEIKFLFSNEPIDLKDTKHFVYYYNDSPFPLFIRNREDGDRIKLDVGTKKIKDVFIDQKIPALERDQLLLVSDKDFVLWVPGIKSCKVNKNLQNKLYIYEVKSC